MTYPTDSRDAMFFVLVNARGQHSMWPDLVPVPQEWTVVFGSARRDRCLNFIEQTVIDADQRIGSLRRARSVRPVRPSAAERSP